MNPLSSSKSQLELTQFNDLYSTPFPLRVSTTMNKNKSKSKKKKKSVLHVNKRTHFERKLLLLMKIFTPIPFKNVNLSSFSETHQELLKRIGLWEFLNLKFDPELRSDLVMELVVSYDPTEAPHRRCFVNGRPVMLTRGAVGRALGLPCRRKVGVGEEEGFCGFENVVSDEEALFLENVVMKWVVLCGGEEGLEDDDVLEVIRFVKEERRPERVDWAGLVWVMVEKELVKGVELRECYYASHLQWVLRKQRPSLFEEVRKLGFDDSGVRRAELGNSGVDGKESEKKVVKGLVGYQRRKGKSCKIVCSEGEDPSLGCVEGGKEVRLEVILGECQLGGVSFGHVECMNDERLEVVNFGGNVDESMVGDLWEEGGGSVGRKSGTVNGDSGEEVKNGLLMGLENEEGRKRSEVEDECLMKEGEDGGGEVGSRSIGLITEVGKEDDCKVDPSFEGGGMVGLKTSGSDDTLAMDIRNEESESLVQNSEQDNLVEVKISRADKMVDLITEQGKDDLLGVESSGVNDDSGGKCDDKTLMGLESDKDRLSSMQDGSAYVLEGEGLMTEDRGGEARNDNMCLITGERKEDNSKADFTVEGGDIEMGGSDDMCAMQIGKRNSGLLVQCGEENDVADVNMRGSDDDGVKHVENELPDQYTEQGKDDQLKLDALVKDDEAVISVETSCSGESYAMEQESERVRFCSVQVEQELKEKQLVHDQIPFIEGNTDNEAGGYGKGHDEQMLASSEKEGEDRSTDLCLIPGEMKEDAGRSIDLCLMPGEMKIEGLLKEGEGIEMSSADDGNGKELEIRQTNLMLGHENSGMENQEIGMGLMQGEKATVLVQADFLKQDGVVVDEGRVGDSSGNLFESTKIDSCARQSACGNDFLEVVREENVVSLEGSEEKHKNQGTFQHCNLSMDAGNEPQSRNAVEVREEVNADVMDMEDQDKRKLIQHCSLYTDTGSDSLSAKVVEISEGDSPHGNFNDCSFVEPFVSAGTSMMDSNFCGNASKRKNAYENDNFVEPFVLEHNINANMGGSSVFENPLKTEIDLLNDGHKRLRTEGRSEKKPVTNVDISGASMFPLMRDMNHTNDGHGRRRSEGQWNTDLVDVSSWGEQVDFWLARTKMAFAAREDAWLSAKQEEQMLSKKLGQLDYTIHLLKKSKHEELQERNSRINSLEIELFFMANQVHHYKKALETTRETFAAFRERCKPPEEPLYVDIPGSGGMVLSSTEWEKERLRCEQEERNNRLDMMISTFQLHWLNQFEGHVKRIESLGDRMSDVEKEVKDLKKISK